MIATTALLNKRWYPLIQNKAGLAYSLSKARFNVVPAGRRSGKTERAKRKWVRRAIEFGITHPHINDGFFVFGAPTYRQARNIYWKDLKALVPEGIIKKIREVEMTIELVTGVTIGCIGLDTPERHEGRPIDGGVLDEYGNMKKTVWGQHLRPALSTPGRLGALDFIGVPEGRNHYHSLYQFAIGNESGKDWAGFTWASIEILDPHEIAAARRDLDELTFNQEYNADFVTFAGRAYYAFGDHNIVADLRYDPNIPLILCFDFNVSPGVAAICQEQRRPGSNDPDDTVTVVLDTIFIERGSNTLMVCDKIIERWGKHQAPVKGYGDKSGGNRNSAGVMGTDWDLIEARMHRHFGGRYSTAILPGSNGPVRARLNAMNSRCKSMDGTVSFYINPTKGQEAIEDFEGVRVTEDGSIDKKDLSLTHLTDAIGYYVVEEFPVTGDGSTETTLTY